MADQVLDVLAAADARAIVHRDIKPANLFLTTTGLVKVLDFGVARMRDAQGQHTTHSGMALGTPAFMAPEQAIGRSEDVSGRTDLWALGATMFALATGRAVHQASSGQQQIVYAATRSAESLGTVDPTAPARAVALVDRALAFHPHARWENAVAMRAALREAYRDLYGEDPSPSILAPLAPSPDAAPQASLPPASPPPVAADAGTPASLSSPRSPLASTLPITPVEVPPRSRAAERAADPSGRTAVSLVGTASRTGATLTSRARVAAWGGALMAVGALLGAWAVARGHRSPSLPVAASTGTVVTAEPLAPVGSYLAPSAPPGGSTTAAVPPSASGAPPTSGTAGAPAPLPVKPRPVAGADVPSVRGKNAKTPAAAESSPPSDRFDHQ
jgi:serine/threonine-protein kinase